MSAGPSLFCFLNTVVLLVFLIAVLARSFVRSLVQTDEFLTMYNCLNKLRAMRAWPIALYTLRRISVEGWPSWNHVCMDRHRRNTALKDGQTGRSLLSSAHPSNRLSSRLLSFFPFLPQSELLYSKQCGVFRVRAAPIYSATAAHSCHWPRPGNKA